MECYLAKKEGSCSQLISINYPEQLVRTWSRKRKTRKSKYWYLVSCQNYLHNHFLLLSSFMFPWTLFLLSLSFVLSYSILFSVLFTLGLCCYLIPLCIFFLIVILFECWKNCKTQSIPTHFKKRQGKGWICQKNLKTQSIPSYFENKAGQGPILSKESKNSIYSTHFEHTAGQRPILSKKI